MHCLSCEVNDKRTTYNASLKTCPCDVKFYDNTAALCNGCHYSCKTCSLGNAATDCLSCDDFSNFRVLNSNKCDCLAKYYDDGANELCVACNYTC